MDDMIFPTALNILGCWQSWFRNWLLHSSLLQVFGFLSLSYQCAEK